MHRQLWIIMTLALTNMATAQVFDTRPTEPPRYNPNTRELFINYTTTGREITETIFFPVEENYYLWSWEQDPALGMRLRMINDTAFGLTVFNNPLSPFARNRYTIEMCRSITDQFANPLDSALEQNPINCRGYRSTMRILDVGREQVWEFTHKPDGFEFHVGMGQGGGGGIGCVPLPYCYVSTITHGTTPSSVNTETNFNHQAQVTMSTGSGCSCVLQWQDRPFGTYVTYGSSYAASYSNSVTKVISGSNPLIIYGSGTYSITAQCGGKHGNAYLKLTAGSQSSTKTLACNDVVVPTVAQVNPDDPNVTSTYLNSFQCNATDNTDLDSLELWTNFTGSWAQTNSTALGDLTYTADETWNHYIPPGNYSWACKVEDTRTPTNDQWTTNRTINVLPRYLCNTTYYGFGNWDINEDVNCTQENYDNTSILGNITINQPHYLWTQNTFLRWHLDTYALIIKALATYQYSP